MDILKHFFTESDNTTFCPVRVGSGIVGTLYHVAAGIGLFTAAIHFDMATLGQYMNHMLELIGGGALSVGAKSIMKADAK